MWRRFTIVSLVLAAGALAAGAPFYSSFLGASAGLPVSFAPLDLPPVAVQLPATVSVSGGAVVRLAAVGGAFDPDLQTLLEGNTVIRTEKQMRQVWKQLFAVPYDSSLFDFSDSFVVLMGGGVVANGSFTISDVEQVDAQWTSVGGHGDPEETLPFLAVTATTFFSGVQQQDPPPPTQRLSAVRIPNDLGDDVVFHRAVIFGI